MHTQMHTNNSTKHTPTPWRVMPCPDHAGKHPCHDSRWIVSGNPEIERGHDPRPGNWTINGGTLICEMRDHVSAPEADAAFIVRACNAHDALVEALETMVKELALAFAHAECDLRMWPISDLESIEHESLKTAARRYFDALKAARAVLAKLST